MTLRPAARPYGPADPAAGNEVGTCILRMSGSVPEADDETQEKDHAPPPVVGRPMAASCILDAAFEAATSHDVRARMTSGNPLAAVIRTPTSAWVKPFEAHFRERFGSQWITVGRDGSMRGLHKASVGNDEVSTLLTKGRCVAGIAATTTILPATLVAAADITIEIKTPNGRVIGDALHRFGEPASFDIEDHIAAGLDFHDLVAAIRAGSSAAQIIGRLRAASNSLTRSPTGAVPELESAVEYGAAREWGLALVRDIIDYRAGRLPWRDVDRGAVLHSQPGLGKTLFARVLAQACGLPLIATSIADLFAHSSGELDGVIKASREVFARARALAPSMMFLDELDALPNRASLSQRGRDWWTPVITDFLLMLDSAIAGDREGVIVIGATNFIEQIDAALLRPGRLEKSIEIRRPNAAGVVNILRFHLGRDLRDCDLTDVGYLAAGLTGAELMHTVRSARRAARYAQREITVGDLIDSFVCPEEMPPAARRRTAIHEAGHAVVALAISAGLLRYVSVGRQTGGIGETAFGPGATDLETRTSVEDHVTIMLAGRAAEIVLLAEACAGAGGADTSDLALASQKIAALYVSDGLGDSLCYLGSRQSAMEMLRHDRPLRGRVARDLQKLQERAVALVEGRRDAIIAVADALARRGHLSADAVAKIVAGTGVDAPKGCPRTRSR